MAEVNILDELSAVEEVSIAQSVVKQFLEKEKLPDKELKALRKKMGLPKKVQFFGVELTKLRALARMLHKKFKIYDFPRFFKLVEVLWNPNTSLDEHYLALLLIQLRRKDLSEVDVCLDLWNWLWADFKNNVYDWSLTELIASSIGYQIIETWQTIEDEETNQIIWDSLKEKATDDASGPYGKIFAVLCPVKRIQKLGEAAVLPSLEVILSAIAKFEVDDKEIGDAMTRAIILTMRECAKTNPIIVLEFLNKFYKYLPDEVIKDMSRYYKKEPEKEKYKKIVELKASATEEK